MYNKIQHKKRNEEHNTFYVRLKMHVSRINQCYQLSIIQQQRKSAIKKNYWNKYIEWHYVVKECI